uniref:Uncharacterized protein n=1 Tax=Siphoviridae sp. ctpbe1 TaxID=2826466 RepID=A0A8S5NNV5_9CAUD|nr:MAG TPA: hypothetical protein [Siphoviridae sp. ctpbe1]
MNKLFRFSATILILVFIMILDQILRRVIR